jgi:hypothetical protein
MPNSETELYFTVAELVPYTAPLAKAVKLVIEMYEFGKADKRDLAIALLQQDIARIRQELAHINQRLDDAIVRIAKIENRQRVRALDDQALELEALAFRLSAQTAAEVAFEAGQRADVFLSDSDLWLWSDVKKTVVTNEGGQPSETVALVPPDFKSYPALAVYSYALVLFMAAVQMETGANRQLVQSRHGTRLRRHIESVSVRAGWVDGEQDPKTLPEQIKSRITCTPVAQHKYARLGKCRFTIECRDVIARSMGDVGEVTVDMPEGNSVVCSADPNLGWAEEQQAEEKDDGIRVLATLEKMLRQLEMSGSLGEQYIGQFGGWSRAQQQFAIRAHVAAGEGFLGGFPTFRETTHGVDVYGGTVFLTRNAGERRDVQLADLGGLSLTELSDRKFGDWMRATNTYASANGFIGGFPAGFFGDAGQGTVCPTILIRHETAEWRDVYLDELGMPSLDDIEARFRASHDYAIAGGFVGGFPNLFHALVGDEPRPTRRRGIVCGTILIRRGFGEFRNLFLFRGPR